MTSRPSLGVQQRQPQRSLGMPGLSQRPPATSYLPSDHGDVAQQQQLHQQQQQQQQAPQQAPQLQPQQQQSRNGTLWRGGSRLKLELSNDPITAIPVAVGVESSHSIDSSRVFTPSRIMSMADAQDLGDMSPHPSARGLNLADDAAPELPMPRRRPRFPVPDSRRRVPPAQPQPVKKDNRPKPWSAEVPPAAPRYQPRAATDLPSGGGTAGKGGAGSSALRPAPGSVSRSAADIASREPRPNSHADLFFWTGDHPEDRFSHQLIQIGFSDKLFAQPETNSAKGSVFQVLKQQRVLRELSSIFTEVLDCRRSRGEIPRGAADFKPPPRVTLTDTKREAWLKDLANSDISLRRLSRTIPHGIRGRVLLDQCMNKGVPTERAVWLAKCVGANELRAVKKKGMGGPPHLGGEIKWIRDWTICIEQFIEATVSAVQLPDWKNRIAYSLRLSRYLFHEQLLDKEHYAEWLASGLENSSSNKLPLWIVLTRIYWRELLRLRKYARRIVGALLSHLRIVQTHPDREVLHPLTSNLSSMVAHLVTSSPESFISPTTWLQYRDVLQNGPHTGDMAFQAAFQSIDARNELLSSNSTRSQPAARSVLVKMLDATIHSAIPDNISAQCWAAAKDKTVVVRTVLEWCTSAQRPELCKVYLTKKLLQSWTVLGLDTTAAILHFLDSDTLEGSGSKQLLFRLVSEMVRSELFSMNRYIIEWLIARGGLSDQDQVAPDAPCATRLLVEVPTYNMPERLRNLRDSMLRRACYPVRDQAQEIEQAVSLMHVVMGFHRIDASRHHSYHRQQPLAQNGHQVPSMPLRLYTERLSKTGCAVKLHVGFHLRNAIISDPGILHRTSIQDSRKDPLEAFHAARWILETCQDYSMLAEVIEAVLRTSNTDLLAGCCETLDHHFQVFGSLGFSALLFDSLLKKLSPAPDEPPVQLSRNLIASLASVASRMPGKADLASRLSMDLAVFDRSSTIDACSPVSDNNPPESELHEDSAIEKALGSGNTIDKHTMERLFNSIAGRLQQCKVGGDDDPGPRPQITLLTRLRAFDQRHFDSLMVRWVQTQAKSTQWASIQLLWPPMVSLGCLSLPIVLSALYGDPSGATLGAAGKGVPYHVTAHAGAGAVAGAATGNSYAAQFLSPSSTCASRLHQGLLQLLLSPFPDSHPSVMTVDEAYRFRIAQFRLPKTSPVLLLTLMLFALAEYSLCLASREADVASHIFATGTAKDRLPLDTKSTQAALRRALREMILSDSNTVARVLSSRHTDPRVIVLFEILIEKILVPSLPRGERVSFDQVLELTNELTMPFCQVKLIVSLASSSSSTPGDPNASTAGSDLAAERLQRHLDLFGRAMDAAMDARNVAWTGLLGCLSPEIAQHLKNRAQARFLELIPSPGHFSRGQEADHEVKMGDAYAEDATGHDGRVPRWKQSVKVAEGLVSVIDTIVRGGSMGRPPQLVSAMVEKLTDLWEMLGGTAASGVSASSCGSPADEETCDAIRQHWLPLLLTVMTLHMSTFDSSKPSAEVRAKALLALAGLAVDLRGRDSKEQLSASSGFSAVPYPSSAVSTSAPYTFATPMGFDTAPVAIPGAALDGFNQAPALAPSSPPLSQRVMDLALVLADSLPDEVRASCAGMLRKVSAADATLRYLFSWPVGDVAADRHWLVASATAPTSGSNGGGACSLSTVKGLWLPTPTASPSTGAEAERRVAQPRAPAARGAALGSVASVAPIKTEENPQSCGQNWFCRNFVPKRWELLNEPNNGENGGSVRLTLFQATKLQ